MMKPRDYQAAAVTSIFEYFASGKKGNPVVVLPTGTGKSVVIGEFIKQALMNYPGTRIMKLTHSKHLIEQNLEKLLAIWPTAPAGVYSAGLKRKDLNFPILFGGVGTVARKDADYFGSVDLLLIDECHLVSSNESTMYQKVIKALKAINPHLKVIGFTATHYRLGQGMLTDEGGLFTDICFDMSQLDSFNWFLTEGYLVPLIPKPTLTTLDISGVRSSSGEYKQGELQAAVDQNSITYSAVQEMIVQGEGRNCWLVFASGIEHAIHISEMLESLGVPATYVHSKMTPAEQETNLAAFKQGKYRAMVNNGIFTTGFDHPAIDLIGMLRPTQSPGLWVQMLGRGTRPFYAKGFSLTTAEERLLAIANSSKRNCLVMDFAGNTRRLGPINDPVLPKGREKGGGGTAPVKVCEQCNTYNHASVRFCINCGAEFPKHVKIKEFAGTEALIATNVVVTEIFKVDRVTYAQHVKEDRPDSIKVSYYCGLRVFKEYVCLEHEGFARKRARDFWRERAQDEPPETTLEALTLIDTLRTPSHIRVWLKPKYDEILGYCYDGTAFGEKR